MARRFLSLSQLSRRVNDILKTIDEYIDNLPREDLGRAGFKVHKGLLAQEIILLAQARGRLRDAAMRDWAGRLSDDEADRLDGQAAEIVSHVEELLDEVEKAVSDFNPGRAKTK